MMYIQQVPVNILNLRFDPEHYTPKSVQLEMILDTMNAEELRLVVAPDRPITNGVRGPDIVKSQFKLVRLQNCIDWQVDFEHCQTISQSQFYSNKRASLKVDDIVVAIGGYLGNAAIVLEEESAVIGQHSALLSFHGVNAIDSRFVLAYLNSLYGEIQFSRWSRGSVQVGLNLGDVAKIRIPRPNLQAQKYIGNKVRQAESLRSYKKRSIKHVRTILDQVLPGHPEESPLSNRVGSISFRNEGWGPRSYRKHRLTLRAAIQQRNHSKVEDIASVRSGCPVPGIEMKKEDISVSLIKNGDIKEFSFDSPTKDKISSTYYIQNPHYHAKAGMVVVCLDGEIRSQYFLDEDLPALVNQRVAIVFPKKKSSTIKKTISSELLSTWLNHPCLQEQLLQWSVKTTVEHISNDIIKNVLIPRMEEDTEKALTQKIKSYRQADYYAQKLTTAAKYLVEALIEQKVTEEVLIEAQEALEDGDNSKDRAILARLTVDGFDIQGADPLFPDLDRLYELIEQAKEPEEEDSSSEESSEDSGEQ